MRYNKGRFKIGIKSEKKIELDNEIILEVGICSEE